MSSLAEVYPQEQARLRELIGQYKEIGSQGAFGALILEDLARRADAAAAEGDVIAMIRCYEEMKASK